LKERTVSGSNRFDIGVIFATARKVVLEPANFYRNLAPAGGFANPVIFGLVMSAVAGLLISLLASAGLGTPGAGVAGALFGVLVMPFFMLIGSFVLATVLFVIWKLLGSDGTYQFAFRCVAFAFAILPLVALASVVPYLGTTLRVVWGIALMVIASITAHKISRNKALLVFLAIGAFSLYSNLKAEHEARKLQQMAEGFKEEWRRSSNPPLNSWPGLDPSSSPGVGDRQGPPPASGGSQGNAPAPPPGSALGKATSDFLRGLQEGGGDLMTPEEQAGLARAGESVGKLIDKLTQSAKDLQAQGIDEMTPKEAGAAIGALLKDLQQAAGEIEADLVGIDRGGAPVLESSEIAALETLGTIEKQAGGDVLQLAVNDDEQFAALTRPVNVYRDSGGIRYRLWMDKADLARFRQLGMASTARGTDSSTLQSIDLRNAVVFVYDHDGLIRGGDQCRSSVLQIPPNSQPSAAGKDQELWLWCPLAQRSRID
jgi:hypothetical protein